MREKDIELFEDALKELLVEQMFLMTESEVLVAKVLKTKLKSKELKSLIGRALVKSPNLLFTGSPAAVILGISPLNIKWRESIAYNPKSLDNKINFFYQFTKIPEPKSLEEKFNLYLKSRDSYL